MGRFLIALVGLLMLAAPAWAQEAADTASRTESAKAELASLLKELEGMRYDKTFHELGFSAKNPTASDWHRRVEALRDQLDPQKDLPVMLRAAPGSLLGLGLKWQRNKGATNDDAKWDLEMVKDALK